MVFLVSRVITFLENVGQLGEVSTVHKNVLETMSKFCQIGAGNHKDI